MGYDEAGRKSRSTNNKRVVKYKAKKGADFDNDSIKSIKTKTKYDKEGEIKKIKRIKKTKDGGKTITISKPGLENNSLSPEGATGLVTVKVIKNKKAEKSPAEMKGSPYMMYGKEMSPMTMKGESPLAKYGCSKKYKK